MRWILGVNLIEIWCWWPFNKPIDEDSKASNLMSVFIPSVDVLGLMLNVSHPPLPFNWLFFRWCDELRAIHLASPQRSITPSKRSGKSTWTTSSCCLVTGLPGPAPLLTLLMSAPPGTTCMYPESGSPAYPRRIIQTHPWGGRVPAGAPWGALTPGAAAPPAGSVGQTDRCLLLVLQPQWTLTCSY